MACKRSAVRFRLAPPILSKTNKWCESGKTALATEAATSPKNIFREFIFAQDSLLGHEPILFARRAVRRTA
jgi:hypothetical protein